MRFRREKGSIQVFARQDKDCLRFDSINNGIGIEEKTAVTSKERRAKGEHFTGIGVENVDDRITNDLRQRLPESKY